MRKVNAFRNGGEWRVLPTSLSLAQEIAHACGVSHTIAQALANRGLTSGNEAKAFLKADLEDLKDPFVLSDMDVAANRLAQAIRCGEKVAIYGDYDVDGVTSTALLYMALSQLGGRVSYYIPDRITEGYGLNNDALSQIAHSGVRLVVASDCGIRSCQEIEFARSLGMEIIILDHHLPGPDLPAATAVVCPKVGDSTHPFRDLASVGLAFKLGEALLQTLDVKTTNYSRAFLDFVALGTLADIVPLRGENRTLAKRGLEALSETRKPGLIALMQTAGIKKISEREVAFALAPRLNAAGRLRHARLALHLLLTREDDAAKHLAQELEQANNDRQKEQRKVQREVSCLLGLELANGAQDLSATLADEEREACAASPRGAVKARAVVAWAEGWHEGVLGIVASRLVEQTGCPTILLAIKGEEAKGSARSIPGFNISEGLERCSPLLLRSGGHAQAAGLSLLAKNLPAFKELFNSVVQEMIVEPTPTSALEVDAVLPLSQVTLRLLEEVEALAPFGEGNPCPLFVSEGAVPSDIRRVGADRSHLVFNLSSPDENTLRRCVAFNVGLLELEERRPISVCFSVRPDDFGNGLHPQLEVLDIKKDE